ncbi:MAG: hypothetical protein NC393_10270 [Clostridium sp.]|nr:hypothetical protein [Clostridium sp.]MCM1207487.1 hypothetical protein [Ruminococcus sp.]
MQNFKQDTIRKVVVVLVVLAVLGVVIAICLSGTKENSETTTEDPNGDQPYGVIISSEVMEEIAE